MVSPHTLLLPRVRSSEAGVDWLGVPLRFDVDVDSPEIVVEGYRLYAVEKWLVERDSTVTTLVVYTGDHSHQITVTALRPSASLPAAEAEAEWEKALSHLRRDSRPRKTALGTLLVTSLARFRSDFTIVHIPAGNFLHVQDQLFANINLSRMGCGGRSALTLEEPSDATKERFLAFYHLPDMSYPISSAHSPASSTAQLASIPGSPSLNAATSSSPTTAATAHQRRQSRRVSQPVNVPWGELSDQKAKEVSKRPRVLVPTKDRQVFCLAVLELVKLVQAALVISGVLEPCVSDGLLCDKTLEGLKRWATEVGNPAVGGGLLHTSGRCTEPDVICALLSIVLASRNKLAALASPSREREKTVPKDPFLYPQAFVSALTNWVHTHSHDRHHHNSLHKLRQARANSVSDVNVQLSAPPYTGGASNNSGSSNSLSPHLSLTLPKPPFLHDKKEKEKREHPPFHLPDVLTNVQPISHRSTPAPSIFTTAPTPPPNASSLYFPPQYSGAVTPGLTPLPTPGTSGATTPYFSLASASEQQQQQPQQRVVLDLHTLHVLWAAYADSNASFVQLPSASTAAAAATSAENLAPLPGAEREREKDKDRDRDGTGKLSLTGLALGSTLAAAVGVAGNGGGDGAGAGLAGAFGVGAGDREDAAGVLEPTVDLADFVRRVLGGGSAGQGGGGGGGGSDRLGLGLGSGVGVGTRDKGKGKDFKRKSKLGKEIADLKNKGKKRESLSVALGVLRGEDSSEDAAAAAERDEGGGGKREKRPFRPKYRPYDSSGAAVLVLSGSVAGSVRGLWGGRVGAVVRLREKIAERDMLQGEPDDFALLGKGKRQKQKERERENQARLSAKAAVSEGDSDNAGRSTGEEYDPALSNAGSLSSTTGKLFGKNGKVRGKIESWTGLSKLDAKLIRKKHVSNASIDSIAAAHALAQASGLQDLTSPPMNGKPSISVSTKGSLEVQTDQDRPHSPLTDGYGPYANDDDDDLLSSGQASPIVGGPRTPKPFGMLRLDGNASHIGSLLTSAQSKKSSMNLNTSDPDYDKKVASILPKKPWGNRFQPTRISSWSDPLSARHGLEEDQRGSSRPNAMDTDDPNGQDDQSPSRAVHRRNTVLGGRIHDEPGDMADHHSEDGHQGAPRTTRAPRRRSFHDLSSLEDMPMLAVERMKIDVDLCGQLLVMSRREEHLRNVVRTLRVLSDRLFDTNARLREEYESRLEDLAIVESKAKVLADLDIEYTVAEKLEHATRALWYEADQMNLNNLWAPAYQSWDETLKMRDKVFTTGGRKLPPGVHGAHGRLNRVQWTLDGNKRLVDRRGRTESEHAAEVEADPNQRPQDKEDEEADFVENPRIKPMWLLRMFTNWGGKWGQPAAAAASANGSGKPDAEKSETKEPANTIESETTSPSPSSVASPS